MYNPFSLDGKTILVTGASSGIGQCTAIACSKMGAYLVVTARKADALQQTMSQLDGVDNLQLMADLSSEEDIKTLVDAIPAVDGIVFCAGQVMTLPFSFASPDKFESLFRVNIFSSVEMLRMLLKKKKINKNASVVFISSVDGNNTFHVGNSVYSATKAAMESVVRSAALELAPKGIRLNSIRPGMIDTKLIRTGGITDDQLKDNLKEYPLKRIGKPDDIANAAIYLLSDASSWVTGSSLIVDGGYTIK